jgi:hypothetical protein
VNIVITADEARTTRYCMAAFDNGIAAIRSAANGHRNETLNNEVLGLAGLIHHNVFTVADLEREAIEAAISVGLPKQEAVDTYKSALKAGLQTPRDPLEKNTPRSSKNTKAAAPQKPASAIDEAQASKDIAERTWSASAPTTAKQWYVARKQGLPDGMREWDSNLVAPLYTLDGELAAVQVISKTGKKFPKGTRPGQFPDACFIVGGKVQDGDIIYIVEGLGQGWTAHQATRKPAAVCFGVGRMAGVAQALHERFPKAHLVLVADVGKEAQMAEIARAVNGSWVECPSELGDGGDINDLHLLDGLPVVADLLNAMKQSISRFKLQTPEELAKLEPIAWRIKRVVPKMGIGAVYGSSTAGKSFWVKRMLAAISRGETFFGYTTCFCPVTYVVSEGEWGVAQRVRAEEQEHGKLPDTFRVITTALDILNADDRQDLVRAIRAAGQGDGIVVFDTLNRAAPGIDENDSADMSNVVAALKWLQEQLGGAVMVVHHTGKDAGRGPRGHSSLFAALDFGIEITRDGDRRTWINRKTRDGEDGKEHAFRLKVVDVGIDEDGDPLTSCVIEEVEDAAGAVQAVRVPAGGNQRIIWDGLGELLRASISFGMAGAPPVRPCVRLDDAIEKLRDRLACESNRRTPRTREAITGLVSRGLLNLRDGWLWCK